MRIGFVQFAPRLGRVEENLAAIERLVPPSADLVVLPELATSGYVFRTRAELDAATVEVLPRLQRLADRRHTAMVVGFPEPGPYNAAALIVPGGRPRVYRKAHLFLNEKRLFKRGDVGLPVFTWRGVRIGILICFDWFFPEAARTMALRGADILCIPANLVLRGKATRGVVVHAITNRIFVVLSNRTGRERGVGFYGQSAVIDPDGRVLARAVRRNECVRVVTIDPRRARDKRVTRVNDLFRDRRPELYAC